VSVSRKTLFITGSSGFIGRHLLQRINLSEYKNVYCLSRTECEITTSLCRYDNFQFIKGTLFDSEVYEPYLASADVIVHLAAATGKMQKEEYFNINTYGTKYLIEKCQKTGKKKIVFISSIAVKFQDISQYYYAQSKRLAEQEVKSSGLSYTIVRPTVVIGKEAPLWKSLTKLVTKYFLIVFGNGNAKIQPIYVEDLVDSILAIINGDLCLNETIELGGPEEASIENFLTRIQQSYHQKGPRVIHLPLGLIIPTLSFLEKYFYSWLPISVGQLSSFRFDGTIVKEQSCYKEFPRMKNIEEMIHIVVEQDKQEIWVKNLFKECESFCFYLIHRKVNEYVQRKYIDGHKMRQAELAMHRLSFDNLLLKIAKLRPFTTKIVDAYTRIFSKYSVFRKKMVLLLAILESCQPFDSHLDKVEACSKIRLFLKVFQGGFSFALISISSAIFILPLQLGFAALSKIRNGR
jgi:nucleoside-diphosphate-sugar epimerase